MPYDHIPGVVASYPDGAFSITRSSTQPKVLVVGPAESGQTNDLFRVAAVSGASTEFGSATPVLRVIHELLAQGADNLYIMRSGGREGRFVLTDSEGETLTITPESRDDEVLNRYALFIENDGIENRYMIYDLTDQAWLYDSDELLVTNEGELQVTDTGIGLFTVGDMTLPDLATSLADLVTGDFTATGAITVDSLTITQGDDGTSASLVEKYAALNTSYFHLDYKDADFVIPADVYVDDANIADDAVDATYGYFWAGVPASGQSSDKLGYLWQYVYQGKLYTYFTDTDDYFSVTPAAASATVATSLELTAKEGKGGNACTIEVALGGSESAGVSINANGGIDVLVTAIDGVTTTSDAASLISDALEAEGWSELLTVSGDTDVIVAAVSKTSLTGGAGGHALTHADLTGDIVPTAVTNRFNAGLDAELRECNFAHQLATFCHVASKNWSTILGSISFKEPSGVSRSEIASWIGTLPEYTDNGTDIYVNVPADNGTGILGNKFLAGRAKTSDGYRASQIEDGTSTNGYAYGGFILTNGAALPNGTKHPYGVDSSDEAVDANNKPVDLGKYIFVTYDWPIHSNAYNGGTNYRGSFAGAFIGKVVTMAENEEPIGLNGKVKKIVSPLRIHSTQLDHLAEIRTIGIRREETGAGLIIVSAKTAAHPDSDYTRLSTIRCVNRHLKSIRAIAKPYIGKPFTTQGLVSLQSAIDQYLVADKAAGYNQGAKAALNFTREDKIMGKLKVKVRLIPPFSIEQITVETSLAAEESEL